MVDNENDRGDRAAAAPGRNRWLPWVIGAVLLIGLILLLRSCGDDDARDAAATGVDDGTTATAAADGSGAVASQSTSWNNQAFADYLGGNEQLGRTFALERITFDSGSVLLDQEGRTQVAEVAAALKARPTARVALRGYADPEGDAAANQTLSAERTTAVRNALIKAGAGENQVQTADAMGETGNAAVAANRRVEITVTAR